MENCNGWQEVRLGEITKLNYGKSLPEKRRIKGNIPVYSSAGLIGYHNEALVNSKGIVIGRKGTAGSVYKSEVSFFPIDTTFYVSESDTECNLDYLFYRFSILGLGKLNSDSAVPGLNRNAAYAQKIVLPPLSEQETIAEVLSSLDDKIDLLHRQNKTLEDMAQTLFRQWFVEEVDEGWETSTISDEFDFTMGQSPPGDSYNEKGIGVPMFQGNADFGFRFPQNRVYSTKPKRFAERYDTLISVRAPVGEQNMAKEKCCIGRGVAAIRHRKSKEFYTYTYFKMKSLMEKIKQFNSTGTVFGAITKTDLGRIETVKPQLEYITSFEKHTRPLNDKIIRNSEHTDILENLRNILLPALMSGKIKVKNINSYFKKRIIMKSIKVKLENCYGINKLDHEFVFDTDQHTFSIYAPNGVMKTSLAKTFEDFISR